jgi:hypothetical protein
MEIVSKILDVDSILIHLFAQEDFTAKNSAHLYAEYGVQREIIVTGRNIKTFSML